MIIARPETLNNTDYKRNKGCRKRGTYITGCYGGILAQNLENAIPLRGMEIIYTILRLVSSHTQ